MGQVLYARNARPRDFEKLISGLGRKAGDVPSVNEYGGTANDIELDEVKYRKIGRCTAVPRNAPNVHPVQAPNTGINGRMVYLNLCISVDGLPICMPPVPFPEQGYTETLSRASPTNCQGKLGFN